MKNTITSVETVTDPAANNMAPTAPAPTIGVGTTDTTANLSQNIAEKLSNLPSMAPDWTNRRKLIFQVVYFCGGVFAILTATICLGVVIGYFRTSLSPIDTGLISLAETLIYTVTFFVTSVIGAYCFGVAFETGAYRKGMVNMTTSIATSSPANSQDGNK